VRKRALEAGEWHKIDLTPLLLEELKAHWAEHPAAGLDDLVFPTRAGRPHDRSNSRGRLRTILKRANTARAKQELPLIAHLTNHTLRRTFASLMYEAGAQPTDVMAQMGHKSSKLALEVYAKRMKVSGTPEHAWTPSYLSTQWAQTRTVVRSRCPPRRLEMAGSRGISMGGAGLEPAATCV
jgi:integrase